MKRREEPEDRAGRLAAKNHPLKNLVYFVIAGICMLFFTLMVLFGFSHPAHFFASHHFPKAFLISTVIIFTCSFFMERVRKAFDRENGKALLNNLIIALGLSLAFAVFQVIGWNELWSADIRLSGVGSEGTPSGAFLFVISGLHLLHLSAGLVFLFLLMFKAVHMTSDDVRCVLYYSDRLEKTRLEMLAKFWHFLGGLWFLLFIYFLWFFI